MQKPRNLYTLKTGIISLLFGVLGWFIATLVILFSQIDSAPSDTQLRASYIATYIIGFLCFAGVSLLRLYMPWGYGRVLLFILLGAYILSSMLLQGLLEKL